MKVLDVDLLQDGLTRNLNRMTRLEKEMTAILQSVEGLVALDDALKGKGGQAIRDFYQSCHVPFLRYFLAFTEEFHTVLEQTRQALTSLEPMDTGHIVEDFLEAEVEDGLTKSADITRELTDETNAIMYMVADIVSLPKLDDSRVQESVANAKRKRDATVEALHTFDRTQTNQLEPIESSIQSMKEWLENIDGLFKQGLTDVNFPSDQWTSMVVGSEITRKLTVRGLSVGNILSKQEASLLIEQAISKKIVVDEYCDINEVSKIAGTYYTLADGRILRKFYGPSGAVTYTFVGKIPKDKVGGVSTEDSGWGVIDSIQLGLDVLGLIPVYGEIADGINGIIYTARGEKINAALSFSAMIPFLGWAGTAGKWINKGVDAVGGVSAAVGKAEKVGKFALHYGGKALEKIKNVLHPDKVKKLAKKVYDDYIKSPVYKSYMSLKDEVKKIKNLQTPFAYQVATPYGNMKIQKTVSEVVQDTKESIVQMAKKLDEAIGGTGNNSKNVGGANKFNFVENAKSHLINVENVNTKKGIVGGHNMDEFTKVLKSQGFNPDDLIISKKPHQSIEGIYEVEYKIPRKDIAGNIAEPVSYKNIKEPKTIYDPSKISDDVIYQWGQEAMQNGKVNGRLVEGTASNGLKFRGYLNEASEITNFFPIID